METFTCFTTEMLLFLLGLTTSILSSVNAEGCDAELWSFRAGMKIKAEPSYFTEKLFSGDAVLDECREWCKGESGCRAVSFVEASGQKTCMMYNHSVVILESDANSDTLIKDFWESSESPICPPTSVWDAPDNWPIADIPSFYQPLDKKACVEMNGTTWSYGKFGNALMSSGSPHYADIVTPEMVDQNPSLYSWMSPESCPNGMSFALWTRLLLNTNSFESIVSGMVKSGPDRSDGFIMYLMFVAAESAMYVTEVQLVAKARVAYKTAAFTLGTWYHFGFTFTLPEEIKIFLNGVELSATNEDLGGPKGLVQPRTIRLGKLYVDASVATSAATWDELIAYNKTLTPGQMAQLYV